MEAIACCVYHNEPVLLTGETGTGKTTMVQYVASQVGAQLAVVNLSQQTDTSDLLGGFKPIDIRCLAQRVLDELLVLLPRVTSKVKNTSFLQTCKHRFEAKNWRGLVKLLKQATQLVESLKCESSDEDMEEEGGREGSERTRGKRKAEEEEKKSKKTISKKTRKQWDEFSEKVAEFERKVETTQGKFAFTFVDGILVKALKEGLWLLLDEVKFCSSSSLLPFLAPSSILLRLFSLLPSPPLPSSHSSLAGQPRPCRDTGAAQRAAGGRARLDIADGEGRGGGGCETS
eukprot:768699-Hanusia_phi.AAC.7